MERKEAIKIVRNIYQTDAEKEALETLIPELAENEDERIRKKLIEIIGYFRSRGIDQQLCEEFIAYLEKQKESLHIPETCKEKAGSFTDEDENIRQALILLVSNDKKNGYTEFYKAQEITCDKVIAFLKKLEQLPTNEEMLRTLRAEYEKGVADTIAKYEQKEQKPEERFEEARKKYQVKWSKDDEAAYDAFMCEVVNEKMNPTIEQIKWLRSIRDRLKSLRPQSKVELSEDVKKTLDEVSHILIGLNYKQVAEDYKQAIEKLLSTRN